MAFASTTFLVTGALSVIALLLVFIAYELWKNNRENLEKREGAVKEKEKSEDLTALRKKEIGMLDGRGAYSYDSVVMDEVLGGKIIEGLKEALRMAEGTYKKLSEKFKDDHEKRIELANDWLNYLEALDNIKQCRIDYRMNSSDGEYLKIAGENERAKLEIEKKFKNLLETP